MVHWKEELKTEESPCAKCPYRLGLVRTLVNPCPQCRRNGFKTFAQFQEKLDRK